METNLDAEVATPTTLRERLAMHRTNKVCASCHNVIDPIGLALENYDLIGKWRISDNGLPIDASGVMVDGTPLKGPEDLRSAILSRSNLFVETLIEKLMTFALGRHVTHGDMPAIRRIAREAEQQGDRFSAIVLGIVKSEPFQMRTGSAPAIPHERTPQLTQFEQRTGDGAG